MKTLVFVAALVASNIALASVNYYNQVALSNSASQVQLADAQYDLIPTKTAIRPIPGCNPNGEQGNICEETIVLESEAVVRANISYVDRTFSSDGNEKSWTSVVFKLSDFTADQVSLLESVYPSWKHPFSSVNRKFAKDHMNLTTETVKQTIKVVDMKKSKICAVNGETGEKLNPNCEDQLVYKDSWTKVLLVKVTLK